ncbi:MULTISPECIES: cytidylyltransferase domain-containing protein [Clostridium]|uniref:CMP-N-acetlyneuraminic acid synthetase n=1 Tax=Clostridium beijerinckii TaxID=1520 RepID=A0A1S9N761_CLOBE|nr:MULTISPECIES: acylneuraminate cytidylyltransferase family protein [Clostridium]MBN7574100.1 acylneuraminate cytidylyltransferase family protein [Clostridium beijerinckii]MBN7577888.1 acylneuraminate cytidylyltransferase family protein [Clostridium beijerinckii]MBN7583850.1 acylneuraminate cytidylyltransferase family protein [Clostridium beijerinckii]MBO0518871.1 acylneuraminate cytidylyltransferase family protein [Clostridium beijerinckii]MZK50032.1 CMP-N-acetlyneuraminic acid synthetase [C
MREKVLAIIPARSGSKGIKDKNIKNLNGKPLMSYTIEEAIKSKVFEDVIVSTDSEKYKKIAEEYGAWVPFLREKKLAEDTSTTIDVVEDVLLKLKIIGKEYDALMILQPTSPLRDKYDIRGALKLFCEKKANSVVSMCECDYPPQLTKRLNDEMKLDGFLSNIKKIRRQDLGKFYRLNGAIYLIKIQYFLKYKYIYQENSYAFIMDKKKSIDIDDLDDFQYTEFLMHKNHFHINNCN